MHQIYPRYKPQLKTKSPPSAESAGLRHKVQHIYLQDDQIKTTDLNGRLLSRIIKANVSTACPTVAVPAAQLSHID